MAINKKGIAFTLISILTATTILTVAFIGDTTPADSYTDTLDLRRDTTDSTTESFTQFFSYHVDRAMKETLTRLGNETLGAGSLYQQPGLPGKTAASTTILNCYSHGRFTDPNGTAHDCYTIHNETQTLEVFAENYTQTNVDITPKNTVLSQSNAEHLDVTTTLQINAEDFTANTRSSSRQTYAVPLNGLPDPMYRFEPNASERPYEPNITFTESLEGWSNESIDRAIMNKWYVHWDEAPSYLQRLANDTTAKSNCCGITSIVNPQNVSNPNNHSHLDHQFWNGECGDDPKRIILGNVSDSALYDADLNTRAIEGAILPIDFIQDAGITNSNIWEDVNCTS